MNENKTNGYVTWRQLIFIAGVFIVVLGYIINLGLDTRERLVRIETILENKGEITFKYNNK